VIFINYGPYHLARAAALARLPDLDAWFIELACSQKIYPWIADKSILADRLITLLDRPYEHSSVSTARRRLLDVLSDLSPRVIAIAGYAQSPLRAAAKWAHGNNCGVVLMSETTAWDRRSRWWRELLKRRWVASNIDAAIVGGRPHKEYAIDLGINKERIWDGYDVVDNDYFARRSKAVRARYLGRFDEVGVRKTYFLYVGRFAPEKNLRNLLHAYKAYRQSNASSWDLVLVGDGPQGADLRHLVASEGIDGVQWPGFKQIEDLPLYYAFAGCFILPSTREPWGLVVNEAMASGLPILVSYRCGCAIDLVRNGINGFMFDPCNIDEMAELMGKVAALPDNDRATMGDASCEIISRWTPEVWAQQLRSAALAASRAKDNP
jgi:glycosyltransferase involved in cell wall biosynthesis